MPGLDDGDLHFHLSFWGSSDDCFYTNVSHTNGYVILTMALSSLQTHCLSQVVWMETFAL